MRDLSSLVELQDKVGSGWAGHVFTANLKIDAYGLPANSNVAVKLFRPAIFIEGGEALKKRIQRELEFGQKNLSGRVVKSFELVNAMFDNFPTLALIMELVPGLSLDKYIVQNFPVSNSILMQITEDLIIGLRDLHANGVVHRDVKPQNIMISNGRATLMDLGVIKISMEQSISQVTATNEFLGTIRYAEREYLFEGKDDELADGWSLGATLFHLLYGKAPYENRSRFAEWVSDIDNNRLKIINGVNRFGTTTTVDHLFLEAIVDSLLRPRKKRLKVKKLATFMQKREKCDFYWEHLEQLGTEVLTDKIVRNPWPVFIPWALYRVRANMGLQGMEKLALCTDFDDLIKDENLRKQIAVTTPTAEDFLQLPREVKIRMAELATVYLVNLSYDEIFRDRAGGIIFPESFAERMLRVEARRCCKTTLKKTD